MSTRFGIVGTSGGGGGNGVTDHNQLTNIGVHTHAELDFIVNEVEKARGNFIDLDARLKNIENNSGSGGGGTAPSLSNYVYESFIVDFETSVISLLNGTYKVGAGELEVFVGGIKQSLNSDYIESSPTSITFTEPLPQGTVVAMRVRDRLGSLLPINISVQNILVTQPVQQFTPSYDFIGEGLSIEVYLNGLLQSINKDFFIQDNTVVFLETPLVGSLITFKVIDKNTNFLPKLLREKWISDGLKTVFKLTEFSYETGKNQLELYVNGVQYSVGIDYEEVSSKYFRLFEAAPIGSEIICYKENGLIKQTSTDGIVGVVDLPSEKVEAIDYVYEVPNGIVTDLISIPTPYTLGEKDLIVFINGQVVNYEEVNQTTIKLPIQVEFQDTIYVKRLPRFTGSSNYILPEILFKGIHYLQDVIEEKTDIITLPETYNIGQQELIVFINGQVVDYEEIDNLTIKLPIEVEDGDQVFVKRFPKIIVNLDKMISKTQKLITVQAGATNIIPIPIQTSSLELRYLRISSSSVMDVLVSVVEDSTDNNGVLIMETNSQNKIIFNDKVPYVNENGESIILLKVTNRSTASITFDVNLKYILYA